MTATWEQQAIQTLRSDMHRTSDTHLYRLDLPCYPNIDVYLKDESTHPTGSLKHRLARSLFLHALCSGRIHEGMPIIEASSGSTAVSEAYFARLLQLPFYAVITQTTSPSKIQLIESLGGHCHFVAHASEVYAAAQNLADEMNGHYMDQFTYAEQATDWRGNNNIAQSIFEQMQLERHPVPTALVMSPGTGGTSATLGRYIRYYGLDTDMVVVDPEYSVFYEGFQQNNPHIIGEKGSRIEGIGRPRMEASFLSGVIDRMIKVPDVASVAAMLWLSERLGRKVGASTGTNVWGVLQVAQEMAAAGQAGSIVTLICDGGERYQDTYYNPEWVSQNIGDITPAQAQIREWTGL